MLIYEKTIDNVRHLFGAMGTVPSNNDKQLVYRDASGNVISEATAKTYKFLYSKIIAPTLGATVQNESEETIPSDAYTLSFTNRATGETVNIGDTVAVGTELNISLVLATGVSFIKTPVVSANGTEIEVTATEESGTITYSASFVVAATGTCAMFANTSKVQHPAVSDTEVKVYVVDQNDVEHLVVGEVVKVTVVGDTVAALSSIAVNTDQTKVSYSDGEELDLAGLVVTATYADTTTKVIPAKVGTDSGYTTSPENGATLSTSDTSVTVSYTEGSVTETVSFDITVQ